MHGINPRQAPHPPNSSRQMPNAGLPPKPCEISGLAAPWIATVVPSFCFVPRYTSMCEEDYNLQRAICKLYNIMTMHSMHCNTTNNISLQHS